MFFKPTPTNNRNMMVLPNYFCIKMNLLGEDDGLVSLLIVGNKILHHASQVRLSGVPVQVDVLSIVSKM